MSRGKWIIVSVICLVAAAAVLLIVLQPEREAVTARDIAELASTNLSAAREKYLKNWRRVKGVVLSNVLVEDAEPPYHTVYVDAGRGFEFQAAFAGKNRPAAETGDEIVFEGYCELCDETIVLFDRCVLISSSTPEAK